MNGDNMQAVGLAPTFAKAALHFYENGKTSASTTTKSRWREK